MKIIVDAFGGDNAPLAMLEGCAQAAAELHTQIILTGDKEKLEAAAREHAVSLAGIEIVHAPDVMPVEEDPVKLRREYKNSSMAVAFQLLADGAGDALVSAGSTGALMVGASVIIRRIKGIKRCAIASVIPNQNGQYLLIDSGANSECRPEMLLQFGIMGSVYMNRIMGMTNPRVGLVNIGTEDSKGTELQIEANKRLKTAGLNYVGNIEAREIPLGGCDVAVCDGFTGNVILKLTEGLAKMFTNELKSMFLSSAGTKLGALLMSKQVKGFRRKLDYTEHGGALMIGSRKTVIKAHGSSNGKAIKNAIRQAVRCVENNVPEEIANHLGAFAQDDSDGDD